MNSPTTPTAAAAPSYAFADDPATPGATQHKYLVSHLAAILDGFTIDRLAPLVGEQSCCLEVAAGASRVATWLADHTGEVVATDVDPVHVPDHPRLRVIRHDLDIDPLPSGRYDLIHCRLLLGHKRNREQLLAKLVEALAPRGVVVIEEFVPGWDRCVLDAPDMPEALRLFGAYHQALTGYLHARGNDTGWGRRVLSVMRWLGLMDVRAVLHAESYYGGQPGCLLPHTAAAQLRPHLEAQGMTGADIDAFRTLLMDERLAIYPNLVISTSGYRP